MKVYEIQGEKNDISQLENKINFFISEFDKKTNTLIVYVDDEDFDIYEATKGYCITIKDVSDFGLISRYHNN